MKKFMCALSILLPFAAITIALVSPTQEEPSGLGDTLAESPGEHWLGPRVLPRWKAEALEADGKIPPGSYRHVGVSAYQIVRTHPVRPPGDALAHVEALIRRSERGDANATYEIHLAISECRTLISDRADHLADSAQRVGAGRQFLEKAERVLRECELLVLNKAVYEVDWLTEAAAQGSQEAMVLYAGSPLAVFGTLERAVRDPQKIADWRRNASGYLSDLARQGNVAALGALADEYRYGRVVDADPVSAYAYSRALQRLNPHFVSTEMMKELEGQLAQGELIRANALSDGIYDNCCKKQGG